MKNRHYLSLLLVAALLWPAGAMAYDFSAVAVTGQTLHYNINNDSISVTLCGHGDSLGSQLVIPNSVTHNGNTYVVTTIGDHALYNCSTLTSVTLPSAATVIGWNAFELCNHLTSISIPNTVHTIGYGAFMNCTALTNVTLPDSLTIIDGHLFHGCTSLSSIAIPNTVTSIGVHAFRGCTDLSSITIPHAVTSIGTEAFNGCTSITSIDIPNSVSVIPDKAFCNCTALQNLNLSDSIVSIGTEAFMNCSSIDTVTIPNIVTAIGNKAFLNCTSINTLILGCAVNTIGYETFRNCTGLTSITSLTAMPPTLGYFTFDLVSNAIPLYVPCGSEPAYLRDPFWSYFINIQCRVAIYTVTVTSSDTTMGTASGGGSYPNGDTATLTATPECGYIFSRWSDGNTDNPRLLVVTTDREISAIFSRDVDTLVIRDTLRHRLEVVSHQETGITVGSGRYSDSTVVEIAAIPVCGNHFVSWSDGNTDNPRHILVTEDISLTATFDADDVGITTVNALPPTITTEGSTITIQGVAGSRVRIYDTLGRLLGSAAHVAATHRFRVSARGVYMVQVDDYAAQSVVVE